MNNTKGKERRDNKSRRLCLLHKKDKEYLSKFAVVPHAGTWIEIKQEANRRAIKLSFPTRERGLKCHDTKKSPDNTSSFPTRERGLKYYEVGRSTKKCSRSPRGNVD